MMATIGEILKAKGIILSETAQEKVPLGEECPRCGEARRRYIHEKRQMRACLTCGYEWRTGYKAPRGGRLCHTGG